MTAYHVLKEYPALAKFWLAHGQLKLQMAIEQMVMSRRLNAWLRDTEQDREREIGNKLLIIGYGYRGLYGSADKCLACYLREMIQDWKPPQAVETLAHTDSLVVTQFCPGLCWAQDAKCWRDDCQCEELEKLVSCTKISYQKRASSELGADVIC
jgi:hypothetical protein